MIRLPQLCAICTTAMRLLRLGKSLIFNPKWNKESLIVPEDRSRIHCSMDSVYSSMVLVSLLIFATAERIFSRDLSFLVICYDFLYHWIILHLVSPRLVFSDSDKQCGTDTPLPKSCICLMMSQNYACIHHPHLGYR